MDYDISFLQLVEQLKQQFILTLLLAIAKTVIGEQRLVLLLETFTQGYVNSDVSSLSEFETERYIRAVYRMHDDILAVLGPQVVSAE